jgi:mannosylfructose-6-phosphate phosphatase
VERLALIATDLDGTLLGDDAALREFSTWYEPIRSRVRLAYSSGRFLDSVRESIRLSNLPTPDAVICGVGTEIFDVAAGTTIDEWPRLRGGWDAEIVAKICLAEGKLQPQPQRFTSQHKVSFYGYDLDEAFFDRLSQRLFAAGQSVSIVYSSRRDLDVLPAGVDKGAAAAFLARRWGIDRARVVVAGDSGNDLAMFGQGFCGIVVGNAQPELRSCREQGVYHAVGHFAAGVIEGLQHWRADLWPPSLQPIN